jgi:putative hydrolase of the HAD superfamily
MKRDFDLILFDLGGVLVELTGIASIMEWTDGTMTVGAMRDLWLTSPGVRKFESGQSTPEEFAVTMLKELSISVAPDHFLNEFKALPLGVYPGAISLLEALSLDFKLACLSNTNEIHWKRICREMGFVRFFDYSFLSYKMEMVKPDRRIFQYVIDTLGMTPDRILFFDDNQMNIDASLAVGMTSYRANGIAGVSEKLEKLSIVPVKH